MAFGAQITGAKMPPISAVPALTQLVLGQWPYPTVFVSNASIVAPPSAKFCKIRLGRLALWRRQCRVQILS